METDEEVQNFQSRLEDRFGKIPKEGLELMRIVRLRRYAKKLGAEKVFMKARKNDSVLCQQP